MPKGYVISDLVHQTPHSVLYRVTDSAGTAFGLTRLIFPPDTLHRIKEGDTFANALKELKALRHGCLRGVLDGGLDEIDFYPWIVTTWWEGDTLQERLKVGALKEEDRNRILQHAQALISGLGDTATALSFSEHSIVEATSADGQKVATFRIDPWNWFAEMAHGRDPAAAKNAPTKLHALYHRIGGTGIIRPPQTAAPTLPLLTPPKEPLPVAKGRSLPWLWLTIGGLVAIIATVFFLNKPDGSSQADSKIVKAESKETTPVVSVSSPESPEPVILPAEAPPQATAVQKPQAQETLYLPSDAALFEKKIGQKVLVQGRVLRLRVSNSKKTAYLLFKEGKAEISAAVLLKGSSIKIGWLKMLEGKIVRIRGVAGYEPGRPPKRRLIRFREKSAIEIMAENK